MMNYFKKILPLLLTALVIVSCGDDDDYDVSPGSQSPSGSKTVNLNANVTTLHQEYGRLEVPRLKGTNDNLVLIHYTSQYGLNYMVEWDCVKKSQRWTCYTLDSRNSVKNVSRYYGDPQYPNDPDLPSVYRFADDPYWGSGYDHGHICPSYDRLCSSEANIQTFYMTNMQPQYNKFNAGLWLNMENFVSNYFKNRTQNGTDTLYICKGGTIDNASQILVTTKKGMIVPKYFYMALLCKNNQGYKAMAFWVEHRNEDRSTDNLFNYVVSIDRLEELTGIDFFCNLPDDTENAVEKVVFPNSWGLKQ